MQRSEIPGLPFFLLLFSAGIGSILAQRISVVSLRNQRPVSFSELIRIEEELLRRLLLVSQRQVEIVDMGNASVLLQFMMQRERLGDEFDRLEKQLAPHKGIPPEKRVWNSPEERQITESAVNRCEELMKEILANDEVSMTKMEALKDKAENDLRRVQLAKTSAPAYAKQSQLPR
jgi:hypothetical protein